MTDAQQPDEQIRAPIQRYQLKLTIGADDWDEMVRILDQFALHCDLHLRELAAEEKSWNGASGHYSYEVRVDPTMTPEHYAAELEAYIAFRDRMKAEQSAQRTKYLRRERDQEHA